MSRPDERLSAYRRAFAELFRDWQVHLPDNAVAPDAAGEVRSDTGSIQYRLREDWGDEYLELYTAQRGGTERVYRIHDDGRAELVAARLADARARGQAREDARRFDHLVSGRGFELPRR